MLRNTADSSRMLRRSPRSRTRADMSTGSPARRTRRRIAGACRPRGSRARARRVPTRGPPPTDARLAAGRPRPTITRAEIALVISPACCWRSSRAGRSSCTCPRIGPDLGDPIRTAWQVAVEGHTMLHNPLHLFHSNAFWPYPHSLTFSDSLLGYGPAGLFGSGTTPRSSATTCCSSSPGRCASSAPTCSPASSGCGRLGGGVAGAAFAYAPYRGPRRPPPGDLLRRHPARALPAAARLPARLAGLVLAGWLVAAWQLSLGFTLGLQYTYMLLVLALLVLYWWRGRRPARRGAGERRRDREAGEPACGARAARSPPAARRHAASASPSSASSSSTRRGPT